MRKRISTIILLSLAFVCQAAAQEMKGLWAGTFETDEVFAAVRLDFDESKIVLSYAGSERPGTIKNLQIAGGAISFDAELQPPARFTGQIANGKVDGTFDILRRDGSKSGSGVWSVRKVEAMSFADDSPAVSVKEKTELPPPTGKFSIGRRFFYWTDESRDETITDDPNDKRKLFVQLWYPAGKGGKQPAEYRPNLLEIQGKNERNEFLAGLKTHAATESKPAGSKRKFPVIIFSPGLGSNPFAYTAIIENLVSHGYAVAAISHPYDTDDFKFSDGQIIRFDSKKWNREAPKDWTAEQRRQFFDERRIGWAQDISFVADRLTKLEKPFAGKFDFEKLGLFGHSFGGQATSIACAADKRFKACANLDGMAQGSVVLPDKQGAYLKQPFLFFNKSAEVTGAELKMMGLSRAEYRAREQKRLLERWKPSFKKQLNELEGGAYFILYPGIKHSSFSDSLLLDTDPKDPLYAERYTVAQNINEYVLAFFDKFLLNKAAPLLDDKTASRSPVVVEFLKKTK